MNTIRPHWRLFHTDSGNGLVASGNKLLSEPMPTKFMLPYGIIMPPVKIHFTHNHYLWKRKHTCNWFGNFTIHIYIYIHLIWYWILCNYRLICNNGIVVTNCGIVVTNKADNSYVIGLANYIYNRHALTPKVSHQLTQWNKNYLGTNTIKKFLF